MPAAMLDMTVASPRCRALEVLEGGHERRAAERASAVTTTLQMLLSASSVDPKKTFTHAQLADGDQEVR